MTNVMCLYHISVEEMDKNDEELRESIVKLWPLQGPKMHGLLVPPDEGNYPHPALTAVSQLFRTNRLVKRATFESIQEA